MFFCLNTKMSFCLKSGCKGTAFCAHSQIYGTKSSFLCTNHPFLCTKTIPRKNKFVFSRYLQSAEDMAEAVLETTAVTSMADALIDDGKCQAMAVGSGEIARQG